MDAIGREHVITRRFLLHASRDIEHHGLGGRVYLPQRDRPVPGSLMKNIPLLARSAVSSINEGFYSLADNMRLCHPGDMGDKVQRDFAKTHFHGVMGMVGHDSATSDAGNKRKRASPAPATLANKVRLPHRTAGSPSTISSSSPSATASRPTPASTTAGSGSSLAETPGERSGTSLAADDTGDIRQTAADLRSLFPDSLEQWDPAAVEEMMTDSGLDYAAQIADLLGKESDY
jgi:hypothetical protein